MRSLTAEEKAQSQAARKQANLVLRADRKKIDLQYVAAVKAKAGKNYLEHLLKQMRAIRDVRGLPAVVRLDDREITLDYELLRGMLRRLKGRRVDMRIRDPFNSYLIILHDDLFSRSKGEIELNQIPDYQRIHLTELPIIELNSD